MEYEEQDDQEFSTGLSPWIKIFFGAVVVAAIFFALGYAFGRNSAPIANPILASDPKLVTTPAGDKPSAAQTQSTATTDAQNTPSQQSDLTFYKAVENKPDAQLTPPPQTKPAPTPQPALVPASQTKPASDMPNVKVGGTIAVQVAAVTKEEDADALVSALRTKNYPVFVVSNIPGDKLFHVQVGPFAEMKDAESVKARLSSDGYNPIIKK